jgi:hypothetical protein
MEKYLMKYNVDGRLYLYIERHKSGKIASVFKISDDNKLLRYDADTEERHFTKYKQPCMLAQRFEAGESWVTIVEAGCDIMKQYEFPEKTATFSFDQNGYTTLFTTSTGFTSNCVTVLGITKTSPEKRRPHIRILPHLG